MDKRIIFIVGLVLLIPIWYLASPLFIGLEEVDEKLILEKTSTSSTETAEKSDFLKFKGVFEKIDYSVEGSFEIFEENNKNILYIKDLDITNGPDLFLVLSNEKSSSIKDFEKIEKLDKKGTFSVEIPDNLNVNEYKYLHIHCVNFAHTFAGGEIQKA